MRQSMQKKGKYVLYLQNFCTFKVRENVRNSTSRELCAPLGADKNDTGVEGYDHDVTAVKCAEILDTIKGDGKQTV